MNVQSNASPVSALHASIAVLLLGACLSAHAELPESIKLPAGNKVVLETVGVGLITYECREKKDAAGQFEWAFVGPDAVLNDRKGKQVGKYYGPPATWESADGVKITGTQLAVSPNGAGNIPLQLVKANPTTGSGGWNGVTYIQRLETKGGTAPTSACNADTKGKKETVSYQADYLFSKAE
ncbi:MAG TPA: DUF3455 domain-containing protein [Rhodocyclaceae bacterium]|jgi:hypothetical protein|nr:DUF3455 domain-containing protein [Rhodocyclaceae bacterium]